MSGMEQSETLPAAQETTSSAGSMSGAEKVLRIVVPVAMLVALVGLWAWYVQAYNIPKYILPSPALVAQSLVNDWPILGAALVVTLKITFAALAIALVGGVLIAILLTQSKWIELALSPYMVILQVTPIVAIAPLILIYAPSTQSA